MLTTNTLRTLKYLFPVHTMNLYSHFWRQETMLIFNCISEKSIRSDLRGHNDQYSWYTESLLNIFWDFGIIVASIQTIFWITCPWQRVPLHSQFWKKPLHIVIPEIQKSCQGVNIYCKIICATLPLFLCSTITHWRVRKIPELSLYVFSIMISYTFKGINFKKTTLVLRLKNLHKIVKWSQCAKYFFSEGP